MKDLRRKSIENLAADARNAGFEGESTVRFKPCALATFSATTPLDG